MKKHKDWQKNCKDNKKIFNPPIKPGKTNKLLKKSEEKLQIQQEELMASNEVLEAKTATLKEQKRAA